MFITLEGTEGSGKTTAIKGIAEVLRSEGHDVLVTREPGGSNIGPKIREILLGGDAISPLAELLLFLADRTQHVEQVIRPHLAKGGVVLCDRFRDSTVAYQGYARGFDVALLEQLNDVATLSLKPDLTLLFDLDPEVGLARQTDKDRLDLEPLEFHQKVREGFLEIMKKEPERVIRVDASLEPQQVQGNCLEIIRSRFVS
jgi:dTMP kinase